MAFSALVTPQVDGIYAGDRSGGAVAARVAVSAIIGGTASVLAGGKFGNGAVTAAFGRAFNAEGGDQDGPSRIEKIAMNVSLSPEFVDFSAGFGDALLFGTGDSLRGMRLDADFGYQA